MGFLTLSNSSIGKSGGESEPDPLTSSAARGIVRPKSLIAGSLKSDISQPSDQIRQKHMSSSV